MPVFLGHCADFANVIKENANGADDPTTDMAFQATPTSTDFGNMDLWWPSYEIFTGNYDQDTEARPEETINGMASGCAPPAFNSLHTMPAPFPMADGAEHFS
jgi:hypothetical protein